jgi:transcriptional regulatory protein GAL4
MENLNVRHVEKTLSSCAECRRKKARCDRAKPCGNCVRFGRECSHEKVSRTPLTRKHLTHVEQELAQAKVLLRQYQRSSTSSIADVLSGSAQLGLRGSHIAEEDLHGDAAEAEDRSHRTKATMNAFEPAIAQGHSLATANSGVIARTNSKRPAVASGNDSPAHSPAFSLERSPNSGPDFDWDERVQHANNAHFVDGMASLTERASRGYMGVASGAALLRLADHTFDNGTDSENDHHDDSMPETPPIPNIVFSSSHLEPFIDAYFQTYHASYPMVNEALFRAQFMEVVPRPKGKAWNVLLHVVSALGSFCSSLTTPEMDVALFEGAKARMSIDMLETGNLTLVQALTLMSNYVQKRNKPNSGYNYMGLAKRMAMGIGLHKEFPAWRSKPMALEVRRRVYWCLYVFDVGAVITFSRPLDMPQEGIEIQLPLNVADSDITATTREFPREAQQTTLYTHVRCQAQFHLATESIYAKLISTHFPSAQEMLQADDSHLVKWLNELPYYFQEGAFVAARFRLCHSVLQWRWRNFRILMYRPFLMRRFLAKRRATMLPDSQADESAIQRCLKAAAESIQLITAYWRHETQNVLACWYSLYFLFQASLIPVICLRNEPHSSLAGNWRNSISNALESMTDMARLNSAASRCHVVIMELCSTYLAQDMSQWDSPTHESPLTQLNALNSFMWPMTDSQFSNANDFAFWESIPMDIFNQFSM